MSALKPASFLPAKCAICGHQNKFRRATCSFCGRRLPIWNSLGFWIILSLLLVMIFFAVT